MPKKIFKGNIEQLSKNNKFYRNVLYTNRKQQLVIMSLLPLEEIGMEKHRHTSQFIRVEKGKGMANINGHRYLLKDGDSVVIPPGTWHNIVNTSKTRSLKLYTIYSPPEHPKNTRQKLKPEND